MKKIITLSALSFILCTAFYKPDYRDGYAGKYFCTRTCIMIGNKQNEQKTNTDTLTIHVMKDILDSTLKLTIEGSVVQMKLKNNILNPRAERARVRGKFITGDSIVFISSTGLGSTCRYEGKRK